VTTTSEAPERRTAATWPITAAMLPFPASTDAPAEAWSAALAEVAFEGFTEIDLTDSWVRCGDLGASRLDELADVLRQRSLVPEAMSVIRRSVIDPEAGDDNLAYSHRSLEAAARLGCSVVSFGLHRPLLPAQREALWFWTVQGPEDSFDDETWATAVSRIRELGDHAAQLGMQLSLEMYEDTLIGSAASAVRFVTDVAHDSVGLNPDLGNLFRLHRQVEPFGEAVAACLPHSNYWHVKNYYRLEDTTTGVILSAPAPMESGSMDYRSAVRLAVQVGFDGPFCVEQYGGDGLSVMASNRDYLRKLLAVATGEHLTAR